MRIGVEALLNRAKDLPISLSSRNEIEEEANKF